MKMNKLDPDGMMNVNRQIFSDLGKWLISSGGMWFYLMGAGTIGFSLLMQLLGDDDLFRGGKGAGIAEMVIGGGLMCIHRLREKFGKNKKE